MCIRDRHATAATTLGRRRVTASAHASPDHVTVDARDAVLLLVTMSAVMTTRRPSSFNARMMPLLLALSAVIFAAGAALKLGKPDDCHFSCALMRCITFNHFTADPVKALHFAILV